MKHEGITRMPAQRLKAPNAMRSKHHNAGCHQKPKTYPRPHRKAKKSDQHLALQKPNPGYPQTSTLYAYRHTTACSAQTLRTSKHRPARLRAKFAPSQRTTPPSLMTAAE
ncbi:hypothetical protein [Paraburkholderia hospita]|uniref:hypothetical protein n=1 Tax=Paraburkholderia hospita TaxID=169430 RepID=UPI001260214F|nr:hypothetical protein [Paraburkholderia hospita]